MVAEFIASNERVYDFKTPLSKANIALSNGEVQVRELFLIERKRKGHSLHSISKDDPAALEEQVRQIGELQRKIQAAETRAAKEEKKGLRQDERSGKIAAASAVKAPDEQLTALTRAAAQLAEIRAKKNKEFRAQTGKGGVQKAIQKNQMGTVKAKPSAVVERDKAFKEMTEDEALEAALAEKCVLCFCGFSGNDVFSGTTATSLNVSRAPYMRATCVHNASSSIALNIGAQVPW